MSGSAAKIVHKIVAHFGLRLPWQIRKIKRVWREFSAEQRAVTRGVVERGEWHRIKLR